VLSRFDARERIGYQHPLRIDAGSVLIMPIPFGMGKFFFSMLSLCRSPGARVVCNVLPLARVRPRDYGDDRLGIAQVADFMGNSRLDEDEVTSRVVYRYREVRPVFVTHTALKDVEHHFEVNVNVRVGDAARRDGRNIHRELPRSDVLAGKSGLVADAIPAARQSRAADHQYSLVAFHIGRQIYFCTSHVCSGRTLEENINVLFVAGKAIPSLHGYFVQNSKPRKPADKLVGGGKGCSRDFVSAYYM